MPHSTRKGSQDEQSILEPIAICGMACRLPGGIDSASSFWDMLVEGRDGQSIRVPESRFNIDAYFHENLERPGSINVKGGYFLNGDPSDFDPTAFGMTPIEAQWLDPQQRKIIEVVYECFESAGVPLDAVSGTNTAVFIGSFTSDYQQMSIRDPDFRHNYVATGVDPGIISNRVGNLFNLNGPSFTINTACSSSVYALHNACHALRARDCDAAIVGGVNLIVTVDQHMNTAKLGILSPTSFCHTFDASADGYGRAEGAGALYIKRLSDAIRDGDVVRTVIRSTAVNTNGKVEGMGITHPSKKGQERVVRAAYERGNLDPDKTAYAELHGTGTPVGDPIEVEAVSNAMNDTRSRARPLLVGAVKPNIGHSEAASGIFAVMKVAMMTEQGLIPGVARLQNINPAINEDGWNVKINAKLSKWPEHFRTKRASVSSFGYGGTNGHVVVEAVDSLYPSYQHGVKMAEAKYDHSTTRSRLVCLSAHDKITLSRNIDAIREVADEYYLADLAYTLNLRRTHHVQRCFAVAGKSSFKDACTEASLKFGTSPKKATEVAFLFTGQGAQYEAMGKVAINTFPIFRDTIRQLDKVLRRLSAPPVLSLEVLLTESHTSISIDQPEFAQPATTAIQIAIVELLASWGVEPTVTIGHSSGEIGAAYAAGLISAPEAILTAYCRGQAVRTSSVPGSMLSVGLSVEDAVPYLKHYENKVFIACENSHSNVTLSGNHDDIQSLRKQLESAGVFARELSTGRAYHSPYMHSVGDAYEKLLTAAKRVLADEDYEWRRPQTSMVSSVTGKKIEDSIKVSDTAYWIANLRNRVLFKTALTEIGTASEFKNIKAMIEIGPRPALSGPFKQICQAEGIQHLSYLPSLVRTTDDETQLLTVAGGLFLNGYPVDLEVVNEEPDSTTNNGKILQALQPLTLVDLPPYQWNYSKRYWAEARASQEVRSLREPRHDLLGRLVAGLSSRSGIWRNFLRHRDIPWLKDHSLGGSAIFPAAGHMSLAIEAIRQMNAINGAAFQGVTLRDIEIKTALTIPTDDTGIEIQVSLSTKEDDGWYTFTVESLQAGVWTENSCGLIMINRKASSHRDLASPVVKEHLAQQIAPKRWYEAFKSVGFEYGPHFQQLRTIRTDHLTQHAAADVQVIRTAEGFVGESNYIVHPATIDACLQLIIISINRGKYKSIPYGVVPIRFDQVRLWMPDPTDVGSPGSATAWTSEQNGRVYHTHTKLAGASGSPIMDVENLRCISYEAAIPPSSDDQTAHDTTTYLETVWKPDVSSVSTKHAATLWPRAFSATETIARLVESLDHKTALRYVRLFGRPEQSLIHTLASIVSRRCKVDAALSSQQDVDRVESLSRDYTNVTICHAQSPIDNIQAANSEGSLLIVDVPTLAEDDRVAASSQFHWILQSADRQEAQHNALSFPGMSAVMELSLPANYYGWAERKVVLFHRTSREHSDVGRPSFALMGVQTKPLQLLQHALQSIGAEISSADITAIDDGRDSCVIFYSLADLDLENLRADEQFEALKQILLSGRRIIWLTQGVNQGQASKSAMAVGLLRVIRTEQASSQIILLDHDVEAPSEDVAWACLMVQQKFQQQTEPEREFWLHDGVLQIPRIRSDYAFNKEFGQGNISLRGEVPPGVQVELNWDSTGLVHSPASASLPVEPPVGCVRLQVESVPRSLHLDEPILVAGKVLACRTNSNQSMLGRTMIALTNSIDRAIIDSDAVVPVDAVSQPRDILKRLPSIIRAVYAALHVGRIQSSDYIVLSKLPPRLRNAFIAIARGLRWQYHVIVSTESERAAVLAAFNLSPDVVSAGADTNIFKETDQREQGFAYLIANDFDAEHRALWRSMPRLGRFIFCGSDTSVRPDPTPFERGASFMIASTRELFKASTRSVQDVLSMSLNLYRAHGAALARGEDAKAEPIEIVDIKYAPKDANNTSLDSSLVLSPEASYFLVGCLGGLGRSLTSLMADRGAKHFAFLSRSGDDKPEAQSVVAELRRRGCEVEVFRGDGANLDDVRKAMAKVERKTPIKGVVHAAMVLTDGIFANMTLADYAACVRPKAGGAQALHDAFASHDLDFFVMTSSISATLGNPGQANYAAANSFLDSLALQRRLSGKAASSLILPMVLGVGVVSESDGLEGALLRKGMYGIDETDMLRGFEVAMLSSRPRAPVDITRPGSSQLILGLETKPLSVAVAGTDLSSVYWYNDTRLRHVRRDIESTVGSVGKTSSGSGFDAEIQAAKAKGRDEVILIIAQHIARRCSSILMVPIEDLDLNGPSIAGYGLDSMIGAEMRNWLYKALGVDVPFQTLLGPTLSFTALAEHVAISRGFLDSE